MAGGATEPRALEVAVVSRSDGQPVPTGCRRNVAVLDGHALARLVEQPLLLSPDVRHRHVEPVDTSLQRVHQPREPVTFDAVDLPSFAPSTPTAR